MATDAAVSPGLFCTGRGVLSTDASFGAKLAPGAAAQLGVKVFLQVRDDALEMCVGDNRNNNRKAGRDLVRSPFSSINHGKLNAGIHQHFNSFLKRIRPCLKATQPL